MKGIPHKYREEIWNFLIENPLRINKKLFIHYYVYQMRNTVEDNLIKKDIDRTFFYFYKHKDFVKIKLEAEKVLLIWKVIIFNF